MVVSLFRKFHFHRESECCTLILTVRLGANRAAAVLHELLTDEETNADALLVDLRRVLRLAELLKQVLALLLAETDPIVDDFAL